MVYCSLYKWPGLSVNRLKLLNSRVHSGIYSFMFSVATLDILNKSKNIVHQKQILCNIYAIVLSMKV